MQVRWFLQPFSCCRLRPIRTIIHIMLVSVVHLNGVQFNLLTADYTAWLSDDMTLYMDIFKSVIVWKLVD